MRKLGMRRVSLGGLTHLLSELQQGALARQLARWISAGNHLDCLFFAPGNLAGGAAVSSVFFAQTLFLSRWSDLYATHMRNTYDA